MIANDIAFVQLLYFMGFHSKFFCCHECCQHYYDKHISSVDFERG